MKTGVAVNKKTAIVRSRITDKRKKQVEKILSKLGMNHSEAINLFYAQVELCKGLPFAVRIPNALTEKVLKDSREGKNVKSYESKEAFFEDIGL